MQTQYITDDTGKKVSAIIPIKEYNQMLEKLDELDCIRAYDKAKMKKQQFVSLPEAFQSIEKNRKSGKR